MVDWMLGELLSLYFNRVALIQADLLKRGQKEKIEACREQLKNDYNMRKELYLEKLTVEEIEDINMRVGFELINLEDLK